MRRLEERVAVVTGAAHGIGRGIAERLAAEGAAVAVADIDGEAGERVAQGLAAQGARAVAVACDVTSREDVERAVGSVVDRFGGLDVLVNNAGGGRSLPEFEDLDTEDWHRQGDLTLLGAVHCVRAALPHLIASRHGGRVVTVGSINALAPFGSVPYSAYKAGLISLTQNLAARYADRGVRFNLVAPGTVGTRVWEDKPGRLEAIGRTVPLGRVGRPGDIAAAVAFLASDDAEWITGVTLPVDGGALLNAGRLFTAASGHDT
ncbi:NAD(P)-dependent dehydrogenase (short-subunit alcohol dehydrogenase family) [Thermocatellispora tengchongensis]|uniref:NAD(P)-dependent dehydrogenase (Short-subunit alcohol dehydrogenase family) n=1 Tax=Thermocatellispora tengchongensis TaxID=1073253 RepID=A0A840PAW9_9ACTN|nr:SDR family NAD(P)-dependent oxidoreductase [Thermocatellispora tengchongensis]MBB5135011.1 NAD(P)-dependent dehydrogenase (short-subunit alcohol dehydrogenase family) [Thermocatellispora tengchongensis]